MTGFRGVTIAELIVASTLTLVIMGLLFSLFVPAKVACVTTDNKAEVNINAYRILNRIRDEMRCTSKNSITYDLSTSPTPLAAISFMSASDSSGVFTTGTDGMPVWQAFIVYYLQNGKLLRKVVPITPAAAVRRMTLAELKACLDGGGYAATYDVYSFVIRPSSSYSDYVDITIGTRLEYSNRNSSIMPSVRIYPEN